MVPFATRPPVAGVNVLFNLRIDQFDQENIRILERVVAAIPTQVEAEAVVAYVRDPQTGGYLLATHRGLSGVQRATIDRVGPEPAATLPTSTTQPFQLIRDDIAWLPREYLIFCEARASLILPLSWDPDDLTVIVAVVGDAQVRFSDRDLTLARGIGDIASLALGSARRVHELERFHELVDSLGAISGRRNRGACVPPPPHPVSASACRWWRGSPSSTASEGGSKTDPAADPRSACSSRMPLIRLCAQPGNGEGREAVGD